MGCGETTGVDDQSSLHHRGEQAFAMELNLNGQLSSVGAFAMELKLNSQLSSVGLGGGLAVEVGFGIRDCAHILSYKG